MWVLLLFPNNVFAGSAQIFLAQLSPIVFSHFTSPIHFQLFPISTLFNLFSSLALVNLLSPCAGCLLNPTLWPCSSAGFLYPLLFLAVQEPIDTEGHRVNWGSFKGPTIHNKSHHMSAYINVPPRKISKIMGEWSKQKTVIEGKLWCASSLPNPMPSTELSPACKSGLLS